MENPLEKPAQIFKGVAFCLLHVWILSSLQTWYEDQNSLNPYANVSGTFATLMTIIYLLFVFLGPKYFRHEAAWNVDGWMQACNAYQTLFNLYTFLGILTYVIRHGMPLAGTFQAPLKPYQVDVQLGFLIYAHYSNKYVELLDTVFMIVRKKQDQVSLLHVFHHAIMPWPWLVVLWYHPDGDVYFGALLNSLVHVVMYSYYFLASLRIPCPWKMYLTQMQLVQFVMVFAYGWYSIYLGFPPGLALIQEALMLILFVMFGIFYADKYSEKHIKQE